MPGLDDLIGSLQQAQGGQGGNAGGGLEDVLGGILGGGSGGGGLGDVLGSVLGGGGAGGGTGGGDLGSILGGMLGGSSGGSVLGGGEGTSSGGGLGGLMAVLGPLLASLLANGGLQKILGGMKANGLSAQADSWVGTGENRPLDAEQVREALSADEIDQVAQRLGVDSDQASQVLAQVIPGLVNTVTPDGEKPSDSDLDKLVKTLEGFSG